MSDSQAVDKCDVKETSKPPATPDSTKKITHVLRRSMPLDDYKTWLCRVKRADVRGFIFENTHKDYFHGYMGKKNNDATMKILKGVLRSTKRLHDFYFHLDESRYEDISDIGLNDLSESIKRIPDLRKVDLDCSECNDITNKGLRKLGQALKYQSSLKSLALKFGRCESITYEGLESLAIRLKTLNSLQHLELDFKDNHLRDWQIIYFGQHLKRLITLKSLTLNFSNFWGCGSLHHFFKRFTSLERISLNFNRCGITDGTLKITSKTLQTLQFLKELCLDCGQNYDLTDTGVDSLCENLKSLTSLKSITLVFSGSSRNDGKITDAGLQSVGQTLKHLVCLRKISFEFSR